MNRGCRKQQDCKRQGVTLIELLIVLAIFVVIAGMGLPSVMRMVDRSRLSSTTRELQAELNRTRLESMKSGEPLVFHYQLGTGCYEIMSKQQYELRFPRQQQMAEMSPNFDPLDSAMPQNAIVPDESLQMQAIGSTGPTLANYGSTTLADSAATQQTSLADRGPASSLADRGPAPSFADRVGEPDTQMIAALPVSKFVPVQKYLQYDLLFANTNSAERRVQNAEGSVEFGVSSLELTEMPPNNSTLQTPNSTLSQSTIHNPQSTTWSEPIFFFPNGRTSNAHFMVCMPDNKRYYIDVSVRGLTGTARLGEIEVMP